LFGLRPLNRSQGDPELRHQKSFTNIEDLNATFDGKIVVIRARLHNTREVGGAMAFFEMRQQYYTV